MEELGTLVKEKENTWAKGCKERSKRGTEIYTMSESMADGAKVEEGDKGRLRKTSKRLRTERDEENEARALPEEVQQNLGEAHARASETERRLCQELENYMYSWDREVGSPKQPQRPNLANDAMH